MSLNGRGIELNWGGGKLAAAEAMTKGILEYLACSN
jgi:hypothetical protein